MPTLVLIATDGTGNTYTLPMASYNNAPTLSGHNSVNINGVTYHYWSTVLRASSTTMSDGTLAFDIPNGLYHVHDINSGYKIRVSLAETGQIQFGPLYVGDTNVGNGSSGGGSNVDDRYIGVCEITTSYGTALACIYSRESANFAGYYIQYAFCFDGIEDIITPDTPTPPYHGDTGHGGGAGDSGGTGGMGSGIDDGDQVSTHKDLDETAKQALLGYGLNAYVIDSGNLLALHKWLWGYDEDYMTALWKKWENYKFNPMAGIVACHRLPNELKPATATAVNVKLAGITLQTSGGLTGVTAAPFSSLANRVWSSEYTVNIYAPKGDFTDFANVQMGVFLPFCGTMALDPTQVMGRPGSPGAVRVQYCCNALTGDCTAFVRGSDQFGNTTILGVANGNCAETHPLCGNDNGMSQKVSGLMSVVGGLAGSILTQNPAPAVGGAISGVSQVAAAQNHTQIIGQPGGANGWASLWTCYVYAYWNVPLDVNDDGEETGYYNTEYGRPSFVSASVSDFSGFTMLSLHADGIATASDEEKREIERLCSEGIII